jgi:hypothetical protein
LATPTRQPAAGGGWWVAVAPERLAGWLERFAARHGPLRFEPGLAVHSATRSVADPKTVNGTVTQAVTAVAGDGSRAECHVPFPPLPLPQSEPPLVAATPAPDELLYGPPGTPLDDPIVQALVDHARTDRQVGVLLVRRGGFAVGVFAGQALQRSKVGQRHVQGRSAAGGWSQQRFARRRDNQARAATTAAADAAAAVFAGAALEAIVGGGDRASVLAVLADPRLAGRRPLLVDRHLPVPDPRRRVLEESPRGFRAVRIRVVEPSAS